MEVDPIVKIAPAPNRWQSPESSARSLLGRMDQVGSLLFSSSDVHLLKAMLEELWHGCLEDASQDLLFAAEKARIHISSAIDLCNSGYDFESDARDFFDEGRQALFEVCDAEAALEKKDATCKLHDWADQAMLRGSGKAHRWTKLPTAWRPFPNQGCDALGRPAS